MPFGCTVAVALTKEQRKAPKTHTQEVGWTGIFMGYGQMTGHGGAYRVMNPKSQKICTVSINLCTAIEDKFMFLLDIDDLQPMSFQPSAAAYADQKEWDKYGFTDEEEEEVLEELSRADPTFWASMFDDPRVITPTIPSETSAPSRIINDMPPLEPMTPLPIKPLPPPKRVDLGEPIMIDIPTEEEEEVEAHEAKDYPMTIITSHLPPIRIPTTAPLAVPSPAAPSRAYPATTPPPPVPTLRRSDRVGRAPQQLPATTTPSSTPPLSPQLLPETTTEDIESGPDDEKQPSLAVSGIVSAKYGIDEVTGKKMFST